MAETILLALAEWAIRATVLAAAVALLLWVARIKDAHVKLTAWTVVLVAVLSMPLVLPVTPQITISVPRFMGKIFPSRRLNRRSTFQGSVPISPRLRPPRAGFPGSRLPLVRGC